MSKIQIGICYICNQPVYDTETFRFNGYEVKHLTPKCKKEGIQRMIKDLPVRHPDYKIPERKVEDGLTRTDTPVQEDKK